MFLNSKRIFLKLVLERKKNVVALTILLSTVDKSISRKITYWANAINFLVGI